MKSIPGFLEVGSLYKLHDLRGVHDPEKCLECIRLVTDVPNSRYSAVLRSTVTGWTITVHGTHIYEDGSIDWDFSTNGMWTRKDSDGCLHQVSWWDI